MRTAERRENEASADRTSAARMVPRRLARLAAMLMSLPLLAGAQPAATPEPAAEIARLAPPAPDYALGESWASGISSSGPADAVPAGASPAAVDPGVDVFFVHPTTDMNPQLWNADPRDATANRWVDESSIARQASAFNGCCRVYAPRYRAATYKAIRDPAHGKAAYALAYGDVERAFDWFIAHVSKGRPFIIAGHSQGAKHVADLLERRIENGPLHARMVAAYIIGINLAEGDFGRRFKHARPCDRPAQTGCVVQWNAISADAELAPVVAAFEKTFTDIHGDVPGKQMLCVNPVTFDRSRSQASTEQARGLVPGDPGSGPMQPLRPRAAAVRCERGLALVRTLPDVVLKALPGGSLHYADIALFYEDIRANTRLRVQAWQAAHRRRR